MKCTMKSFRVISCGAQAVLGAESTHPDGGVDYCVCLTT